MCPRQWDVMRAVVSDTGFLGHIFCALRLLFEVTNFHPSRPDAVTEVGSICVVAQLHTKVQTMSHLNLLIPSKAQTSCLHHLRGTHGETAHLNLQKCCCDPIQSADTQHLAWALYVKLISSFSVCRSVALHLRSGNKPYCQLLVCRNYLLVNAYFPLLTAKMASRKSTGMAV